MNRSFTGEDTLAEVIQIWVGRLLLDGGGLGLLLREREPLGSTLLAPMALDLPLDEVPEPDAVEAALECRLSTLTSAGASPVPPVDANVERLGGRLGLNALERRIVLYLVLCGLQPALIQAHGLCRRVCGCDDAAATATALDVPETDAREALSLRSTLIRTGVVQPETGLIRDDNLGLELHEGLSQQLLAPLESVEDLFLSLFTTAPAPDLTTDDYPHLAWDLRMLTALLKRSAEAGTPGVNVLLHGPPGTGKTQLARLLADQAGLGAVQVNHENAHGEPIEPNERHRTYQVSQSVLARDHATLVIFDEMEDTFQRELGGLLVGTGRGRGGGKAWKNQLLEDNPRPAIWITNQTDAMDAALLRRFAWTLEVRPPPRSVRRRMVAHACAGLPTREAWMDGVAEDGELAPAEIRRVTRLAGKLRDHLPDAETTETFLDTHLHRHARLCGQAPRPRRRRDAALTYRLDHLNAEPEIAGVVGVLNRQGWGALLLHGPPGTGKTALAGHVADQMDRPLLQRPASDLLSSLVGGNERNLADLFDEAREDEAVLLIDEADTFLAARDGARARWEASLTNEVLVQLEAFDGVVICATNHMEAIDAAALRRFDHKVALHPLKTEQVRALFSELCERHGVAAGPSARGRVEALETLTPGDFAAVARGFQGAAVEDAAQLAAALAEECRVKPGGARRRVGFV